MEKNSVINTRISRIDLDGQDCIRKAIRPNVDTGLPLEALKCIVDDYIGSIVRSGIPMPAIHASHVEEGQLVYITQYEGPTVIDDFEAHTFLDELGGRVLPGIIRSLKCAAKAGIHLDPHPKNFVWNGSALHFVDFSPPYSDGFNARRIRLAQGEALDIVRANFDYFKPAHLFHHFAGDFYNIDPSIPERFFRHLHQMMRQHEAMPDDFDVFFEKARKIRALEDRRLAKNIFLF